MFNGPEVGAKHPARYGATRGVLDADSQFWGGESAACKDTPEVLVGHGKLALKLGDGARDEVAKVGHVIESMAFRATVKPNRSSFGIETLAEDVEMNDVWPQRLRFRVLLALYQARNGKTQEQAAEDLGVSLGHLRNLCYRPGRRPSLELIRRASGLFGVALTEFVDSPGVQIGGQDLSSQSDQARFLSTVIVKDMSAEDLSDEDRQELWEDFQRGLARIRKRNARAK